MGDQWELVECLNTQYMGIARSWQLGGILEATTYMTKIADLALMDAHFPDLHVWDGSVLQVELTTPELKGLSYSDFVLAVKIDVTIDALRAQRAEAAEA